MTTVPHEWAWLDQDGSVVSLSDLSHACGLSAQDLRELVDYGALAPLPLPQSEPCFSAEHLIALRTAGKMRLDYDLDIFTVVLLLEGLHRVETLEREIRRLEVLLPVDAQRRQSSEARPDRAIVR